MKKRSIDSITESKIFKKAKRLGNHVGNSDSGEKSSSQTMLNFIRPGLVSKNNLLPSNVEVPGIN